ncbi:MAG TPA: autotransporter-associated beta strand repeat-containing protein, partial [Rariglobus sp.]
MKTLLSPIAGSLFALAFGAALTSAFGASYTWDSDANATIGTPAASTPGSGTWNYVNANWNLAGSAGSDSTWVDGSDAVFAGSDGSYAITVGSALTVNNITFSNSGYTLSAASVLKLTGNTANNLVTVASGATATIGNNVTFTSSVGAVVMSLAGTTAPGGTAGTLIIDNGGKVSAGFGGAGNSILYIGSTANTALKATTVQVNTGGTILGEGAVVANGLLKVEGGSVTSSLGNIVIGNFADANMPTSAVLTIDSGTVTVGNTSNGVRFGTVANTANTGGTLNLNGGTLTTGKIYSGGTSNSSTVNFNGGTLKAATNNTGFLSSTLINNAIVKAGGAIIDTNTFNVTISKALTHDTSLGGTADGGLTKISTGTLTLSGNNTYTGATTISGGTLALGAANRIADSSNLVMSGGTFATGGFSETLGTLTLSANSVIDLGSGTSALVFANSSGTPWGTS